MSNYIIEYMKTNKGIKTVKVNNFLLHSKYDPIKEAKRIVEKEFEPNYVHVVFGYGLGYIVEELKNKIHNKESLIVIDPLWSMLKSGIDKNNDLIFIEEVNHEVIEQAVAKSLSNLSAKVKVICSPNYDNIFEKELLVILESIKTVQRIQQVGENTTRLFSFTWQENYIHNLLHTYTNHSFKELKQRYSCPAIVISGGPSLKKQIHLLNRIKEKVLTIASGSTINSLLYHGIEPDYVVSIDGGVANFNHFKGVNEIKSHLIFGFSSHYKIQEKFHNTQYAILDAGDEDFQSYVKDKFNIEVPLIAGGASVANFAFTIACYMTKGPIAIIGQDLAYTDNKSHEDNNKHSIKIDEAFKKERGMFEVTGYNDDKVLTDYAFLLMKKDFERLNRQIQHPSPIFNCTEGGAKIEGMMQLEFLEFCNRYVDKKIVDKVIISSEQQEIDMNSFISKMQDEISIYSKIITEIEIGLVKLGKNKSSTYFEKSVLRELDKIDKTIKKYRIKTAMNHIFDPITMDVLRNFEPIPGESDTEAYQRVFTQNKELYTRLLEAFKVTKQYILDVIENANKLM